MMRRFGWDWTVVFGFVVIGALIAATWWVLYEAWKAVSG